MATTAQTNNHTTGQPSAAWAAAGTAQRQRQPTERNRKPSSADRLGRHGRLCSTPSLLRSTRNEWPQARAGVPATPERGGYGTQPVIERVLRALAQEPNFPPSSARPEYPCARACRARTRKQKKWNMSARRKARVRKRTHARTHAHRAHLRMHAWRAHVFILTLCALDHRAPTLTRTISARGAGPAGTGRCCLPVDVAKPGATNVPTRRSGGLAGAAHGVTKMLGNAAVPRPDRPWPKAPCMCGHECVEEHVCVHASYTYASMQQESAQADLRATHGCGTRTAPATAHRRAMYDGGGAC